MASLQVHRVHHPPILTSLPLSHGVRAPIRTRLLPQKPLETVLRASFSETESQTQASLSTSSSDGDREIQSFQLLSASEVVKGFYGGINRHDLASVEVLIAENCVYEDLVFPRPFVGRKDIMAFFNKFTDSMSTDLQFVIDDISTEDTKAVGVSWHLEWNGTPFPFSKGCSFYRLEVLNGTRQIVYARDCAEPAIKPGESVLDNMLSICSCTSNGIKSAILRLYSNTRDVFVEYEQGIINAVTWLLQRFPQLVKWL